MLHNQTPLSSTAKRAIGGRAAPHVVPALPCKHRLIEPRCRAPHRHDDDLECIRCPKTVLYYLVLLLSEFRSSSWLRSTEAFTGGKHGRILRKFHACMMRSFATTCMPLLPSTMLSALCGIPLLP